MLRRRIKRTLRRRALAVLDRLDHWFGADEDAVGVVAGAPLDAAPPADDLDEALEEVLDDLTLEQPRDDEPPPAAGPTDGGLTMEAVEALLEDMVRPALQSDGGDITLVKVEAGDVYVRLVGACSSCPSSTVTMRMGIERLLVEEFPDFGRLVQVEGP